MYIQYKQTQSSQTSNRGYYCGAIHAMTSLFLPTTTLILHGWGVLLFDEYNSLNHIAMLLYACALCPHCAKYLFNTYAGLSRLIIRGTSECLYSKEDVCMLLVLYQWYVPFMTLLTDTDLVYS